MQKSTNTHTPLTFVLFFVGLLTEYLLATYAGHDAVINFLVVTGTAIYMYALDDITNFIRKFI